MTLGRNKILEFTGTGLNDPPQQSGRGSIPKRMRDSAFTEAFQEDSVSNTNSCPLRNGVTRTNCTCSVSHWDILLVIYRSGKYSYPYHRLLRR